LARFSEQKSPEKRANAGLFIVMPGKPIENGERQSVRLSVSLS
jgi:hypothetical protein